MGLQSAFDLQLGQSTPLQGFVDLIWQSLLAGCQSSKHPWNLGCFTTVDASGFPQTRTVVLRAADRQQYTLDFHTDIRSDKIEQLSNSPNVHWMFYLPSTKIQLRCVGVACVVEDRDEVDAAWASTALRSRSAYVSVRPPGERVQTPDPPSTADREVDQEASERGVENFAIVRTSIRHMDWLYLRRDGHVRAGIEYVADTEPEAVWWVP
jgi:hypothetical protein